MRIGARRRIYVANVLAKIAEFVVSVLIIGYLVAAKLNTNIQLDLLYLCAAGFLAILFIVVGAYVTPEKEEL